MTLNLSRLTSVSQKSAQKYAQVLYILDSHEFVNIGNIAIKMCALRINYMV